MMERPSPLREPPSKSDAKLVAPHPPPPCYLGGHPKESITLFFIYIYIYAEEIHSICRRPGKEVLVDAR